MSSTAAPDSVANSMPPDSNPPEATTEKERTESGSIVDTVKSYIGLGGTVPAGTVAGMTGWVSSDSGTTGTSGTTTGENPSSAAVDAGHTDTAQRGDSMAEEMKEATGTEDSSMKEEQERKESDPTHKPPQGAGEDNKATSGGKTGSMENKSAIPTAGGERLGEKHWGESQKIPDNPPPQDSGVSSSEGQPTEQVKTNTAANTGGATGGPQSGSGGTQAKDDGGEKASTMDKLKDKMHMGKK